MRRLLLIGGVAVLAGCGGGSKTAGVPGSPQRGHDLIVFYGCGACHQIGGVSSADGHVGPPLRNLATRDTIAGRLPNTPANVVRWIVDPQRYVPGNDMPVLGVPRAQARDIVAYLYGQ